MFLPCFLSSAALKDRKSSDSVVGVKIKRLPRASRPNNLMVLRTNPAAAVTEQQKVLMEAAYVWVNLIYGMDWTGKRRMDERGKEKRREGGRWEKWRMRGRMKSVADVRVRQIELLWSEGR